MLFPFRHPSTRLLYASHSVALYDTTLARLTKDPSMPVSEGDPSGVNIGIGLSQSLKLIYYSHRRTLEIVENLAPTVVQRSLLFLSLHSFSPHPLLFPSPLPLPSPPLSTSSPHPNSLHISPLPSLLPSFIHVSICVTPSPCP